MLTGLLLPLVPGVALAASKEEPQATAESAGAHTLDKLKDKDGVAPSIDSAPTPSIPPPGDPDQILPPGPTRPNWKAGTELVGKRTATTKAFTGRVPGEIETRLYAEPVHFKQGGSWVAIDSGLKASGDGRRKNKANNFGLELAEFADDPALAELVLDSKHSVGFGLDKAAKVKGTADKNSVTYSKVQKDTDVRLTSTKVGVKEELILASPDAPDRFVFPLKLKGLTASIDELGDVVYKDSKGAERARTPHGYMFDSNVDPLSDEPATSTGVTYALIAHGKGTALEVNLSREWMDSKDRIYPIVVDPEIHRGTWGDDTFVMNPFVNDYSSSSELKVGTFNGGANRARSFMHFDTGALPGTVTYAELQMRELHSYNCGAPPEAIFRVTQGWAGSTMRSFPGASYDPSGTLGWWVNGGCPTRLAAWNVTGMVQHFQNIGETMGSFAAVATQETNSNQWKKYRSSQAGDGPVLKVFTNHPPVTPWAVTPTANQRVFTANVGVSAAYADADGTPGYIAFGVWNTAGTLVWAQWSGLQTNYTIAHATTSALADGWYRISTIAWDGQHYSAVWSPDQWFRVDTRRPELSSVTPTTGATVGSPFAVSARYSEPYGYAGQALFAVNRPDGTGVTHAWSGQVPSGQVATASLSITQPGQYDFYAIGNDGAGDPNAYGAAWSGPYRITVAAPPGAPTGVTAEAGPASARIRWSAPSSNGGSPITRYDITAVDGTEPGTTVPPKQCATGCSPSEGFAFDGLIPGHSYTFRATATNAVGTGPASAASAPITVRSTPDYVDQVVATPGDRDVRLDWQAEFLATSYRIQAYRGVRPADGVADPAHLVSSAEVSAADTTETITGLNNGSHYYFTVTPVVLLLLVGPPSAASNEVVPFSVPFAPRDVQALPSDGSAVVMWNPPETQPDGTPGDNGAPITGYRVTTFAGVSTEPLKVTDVAAEPTFTMVEGLQNGTEHSFSVQAINAAGPGAATSTTETASPGGRPFAPENVSASPAGNRSVSVGWSPPGTQADGKPGDNGSPITGYRVIVSPSCASCEGIQPGVATATTITGLSAGVTYQFRVVARNRFGEGTPSSPAQSVAIPAEVPGAPTNVVAEWDPNQPLVRVSWAAPESNGSSITSYRVTGQPGPIEATTTATSAEFANLDPTFAYTFVVRASNSIGEGPASSPSDSAGSPTQPPTNIQITSVKPQDRSAEVMWEDSSGPFRAFGYTVIARQMIGDSVQAVTETPVGAATKAVVNLPRGEYVFVVRGSNAAGQLESAEFQRVTVWNRSEVDEWQFEDSLQEFLQVRAQNIYPYSFDSDFCSVPPIVRGTPYDERFRDACKRHDFGYQNFGRRLEISQNEETKNQVNDRFEVDMRAICNANPDWNQTSCRGAAMLFRDAVDEFDDGFWNDEEWSWSPHVDNPEP